MHMDAKQSWQMYMDPWVVKGLGSLLNYRHRENPFYKFVSLTGQGGPLFFAKSANFDPTRPKTGKFGAK